MWLCRCGAVAVAPPTITRNSPTCIHTRYSLSFTPILPHSGKMLLDEDPATVWTTSYLCHSQTNAHQLIHHTIGNFNIQPDKQAVTRVNDSLSNLQQSRELRISDVESALRKLSRNLHSLNAQHEEASAAHDSAKHAEKIVELDTQKFRIAKAASDLEIETERLEGELEMLKERLADLEAQGLEGDEATRREREIDDTTLYVDSLALMAGYC